VISRIDMMIISITGYQRVDPMTQAFAMGPRSARELATPCSHAKLPQLKTDEIQEVAQRILRDIGNMAGFDPFFGAVVKMLGMRRDMGMVRGIVVPVQEQRTFQPAEISRSNCSRRWG